MEQSENINELAQAMVSVQMELPKLAAVGNNPYYHSKYAPLPYILDKILPVLNKNGLALLQPIRDENVMTMIVHSSGQWISSKYRLYPGKLREGKGFVESYDPQAIGSVITYARRYGLCAMLGLAPDGDDDGAAASQPEKAKLEPGTVSMRRNPPAREVQAEVVEPAAPREIVAGSKQLLIDRIVYHDLDWSDIPDDMKSKIRDKYGSDFDLREHNLEKLNEEQLYKLAGYLDSLKGGK